MRTTIEKPSKAGIFEGFANQQNNFHAKPTTRTDPHTIKISALDRLLARALVLAFLDEDVDDVIALARAIASFDERRMGA